MFRKVAILLMICLFGAAMLGAGMLSVDPDTATTGLSFKAHDAVEGNTATNGGGCDLLDSSSYVTTWKPNGYSEKIILQGKSHYYGSNLIPYAYWAFKYVVKVEGTGADSIEINGNKTSSIVKEVVNSGHYGHGWIPVDALMLEIKNPCEGKITAEFWMKGKYDFLIWESEANAEWVKLASDVAYLRSGAGSISVVSDVVEETKEVKIDLHTEYASSTNPNYAGSEGWTLQIHDGTGTMVHTESIPDKFSGQKTYVIPNGSFDSVNPTGNTWKVTLANDLCMQDEDVFFTIKSGSMDRIPAKPTYEIISGEEPFIAGENVKVKISAEITHNDIKGFLIWVKQESVAGQTTQYVVEEDWVEIDATFTASNGKIYSTATYEWTFPDASDYVLQASTVDSENLNSGKADLNFKTYQPGEQGQKEYGADSTDWGPIFMIGIILSIIGGIMTYVPLPIPRNVKYIGVAMFAIGIVLSIISGLFLFKLIVLLPPST